MSIRKKKSVGDDAGGSLIERKWKAIYVLLEWTWSGREHSVKKEEWTATGETEEEG